MATEINNFIILNYYFILSIIQLILYFPFSMIFANLAVMYSIKARPSVQVEDTSTAISDTKKILLLNIINFIFCQSLRLFYNI